MVTTLDLDDEPIARIKLPAREYGGNPFALIRQVIDTLRSHGEMIAAAAIWGRVQHSQTRKEMMDILREYVTPVPDLGDWWWSDGFARKPSGDWVGKHTPFPVRGGDPETSRRAGMMDPARVNKREEVVYSWFLSHGPATQKTMTDDLEVQGYDQGTTRPRVAALRHKGLIVDTGDKEINPRSGNLLIVWRAVPATEAVSRYRALIDSAKEK